MTFEEFQATGRRCDDLDGNGRGRRYLDILFIEEVLPNWPEAARKEGKWHLLIENCEWITDDLAALERRLYDWAIQSGYVEQPPETEQTLCAEYEAWCEAQELQPMSADELSCELGYARTSTDDPMAIGKITLQLRWLGDFIDRWNRVTNSDLPEGRS